MSKINIQNWDVENPKFWEEEGKKTAARNLWISIPGLTSILFDLDHVGDDHRADEKAGVYPGDSAADAGGFKDF